MSHRRLNTLAQSSLLAFLLLGCGSEKPQTFDNAATGGVVSAVGGGVALGGSSLTNLGGAPSSGGTGSNLPLAGGQNGGGASSSNGSGNSAGNTAASGGTSTQGSTASSSGGTNGSAGGVTARGGSTTLGGTSALTGGTTTRGGTSAGKGGSSSGSGGTTNLGGATSKGGATSTGTTTTPTTNPAADSGLLGFAAVNGMGLPTTTGGKGGSVVVASTLSQLTEYMDSDATLIIQVSGDIDLEGNMVALRSNKTLVGLANARIHNGGIEMYKRQNIIIRNIIFADGTDDTIKINQNSHHIWVDHCDFTNAVDGLFDITRQSSYITISWNHFYKHSKTMLIGHSDAETADVGYLKTTIHHNWFDGTEQRHPRVRFGEVHVFNNYFLSNGLYGVASTMEADVVVEGNFFENVAYPTYSGYQESGPGDVVVRDNHFVGSGTPATRGTAFDPKAAYAYPMDAAEGVAAAVRAFSGVGKIDPVAASK